MAPPRKHKLPSALPENFELTDTDKKKWKLGQIIGKGGFGLIYLASQDLDKPVAQDSSFVIKLENHENGSLFSELKFYQRAAKLENIRRWKQARKMDFLGIPDYWGSGLAEYNGERYRFMVMQRLGTDLHKVLDGNGGRLKPDTVFQLSCILLDVLEYIHQHEHVHADIKAANLMLGHGDPGKVYLADYGLSYRFCPDGVHKEYKENPRKGHNGTIEYTSLDAHKGVAPSRRGDLQILGFCLLHWLCGTLPWNAVLKNPAQVQEAKARLMDNLPNSVLQLPLDRAVSDKMADFFLRVKELGYEQRPDYQALRTLLSGGGRRAGGGQGPLDWSGPAGQLAGASTTRGPDKKQTRPREARSSAAAEEDGGRPKPIAACYLRGPPIGPRAQPDQGKRRRKTAQDETSEDFDLSVTSRQVDLRLTRYARLASPAETVCWRDQEDQEDGPSTTPGLPQNTHSGQAHRSWEEPSYVEEDHSQNCDGDEQDDQRWGDQRWGNQRWGNQRWGNQRLEIRRYCHTDHGGYKQQYGDDGCGGDHADSDYGDSDHGDSDHGDSDHGDGVTRASRQEDSWSSRMYCAAGLVLILLVFLLVRQ